MPELTMIEIGLLALVLLVGVILGWVFRADRCAKEKIAVNASWQQQIESQQSEHDRLAQQNKSLMEQISQYQASHKDSTMRAKELSDSLKEAFGRRDELQRQIKDIRGNLEIAVAQRDRLQTDMQQQDGQDEARTSVLKEKDDKIFRLSRELESWQDRVPPLVDRFRQRDEDAKRLEEELDVALNKISALQVVVGSEQTTIEPVTAESMPDGMDASNEPHSQTSVGELLAESQLLEEQADDAGGITIAENESDEGEALAPDGNNQFVSLQDETDDLKKIKGVGPAIERTLNDLGIDRFHQIAEMSEYDIDRVAQQLKGFRSRIYREDWIGQARSLQHEKSADLN